MSGVESSYIDIVGYKENREPDGQYHELLENILRNGKKVGSALDEEAWTLFAPGHMKFDLRNGFPAVTERDMTQGSRAAFAEITAFINGVRTLDDLKKWGCGFWGDFMSDEKTSKRGLEPGDFGPASYGGAFHDFPTPTGASFNQIKAIVDQIGYRPELRTHVATTIVPPMIFRGPGYEQKVVWTPCHGSLLHFRVIENELYLHHVQRSADVPVGLVFNMIEYAGLLMVIGHITGYRPAEYTHTLSDAHIYTRQESDVEELLTRDPRPFPKALIRAALSDVFEWRKEDIIYEEYDPHPKMLVDTPRG